MRGAGFGSGGSSGELKDLFNRATAAAGDESRMPRALLVFAHPDDEVVAIGGRLPRFSDAHFIHVTDGSPEDKRDRTAHGFSSREAYRDARQQEFAAALSLAGIEDASRECLGYVDQTASFHLVELTRSLAERIERQQTEVVFTHPYEGGHPDHDACAFAVHHARNADRHPLIIEAPFYHLREDRICTGEFLPGTESALQREYALSAEEQERKRRLLACFRTQQQTLQQFSCESERYRVAPEYDLTKPPHRPPLFYDHFPWGMQSEDFCRLAAEAEALLSQDEERRWL
jgi:LmbE family N-acetylglucosaminyl deacetylase